MPVVAFVTKARPSGSAPRNAPDAIARRVEQRRQLVVQEADGLGLHPVAQGLLDGEDRFRTGAVRAVVQEGDGRVEPPAEVGPHVAIMTARRASRVVSPERTTVVGPPGIACQRTSPGPTTRQRIGSAVTSAAIDAGPFGEPQEPEPDRHPCPEPLPRRRPLIAVGVRHDDEAGDDARARARHRRPSRSSRPAPSPRRSPRPAPRPRPGPPAMAAQAGEPRMTVGMRSGSPPGRWMRSATARSATSSGSAALARIDDVRSPSTVDVQPRGRATRPKAATPLAAARSGRPRAAAVGTIADADRPAGTDASRRPRASSASRNGSSPARNSPPPWRATTPLIPARSGRPVA